MRISKKHLNKITAEKTESELIKLTFLSPVTILGNRIVYYYHFLDRRQLKELKKVLSKFK